MMSDGASAGPYAPGEVEWRELLSHLDLRAAIRVAGALTMPVAVGSPVDRDEVVTLVRERLADLHLRLHSPPFEPMHPRHRLVDAFVAGDPTASPRLCEFARARVERIMAETTELRRELWRALAAGSDADRRLAAIDGALVPMLQPVILRRTDARIEREAARTARAFDRVPKPMRQAVASVYQARRWHRFIDGFFAFERARIEPLLHRIARNSSLKSPGFVTESSSTERNLR